MDNKRMSDKQIVDFLMSDLSPGIRYNDTTLKTERTTALKYYYGEYPLRLNAGSSGYRSLDVFDQVETVRSILGETFSGNNLPVVIQATRSGITTAVQMELATWYVNHILFSENPGVEIIEKVIFDALIGRVGIVRVYWEEDTEVEIRSYPEMPLEAAQSLADDPEVEELILELDEETNMATAKATMVKKVGRTKIEVIRPEDFLVNTSASDLKERPIGIRVTKRRSVWMAEGYTEEQLRKADIDEDPLFNADLEARAAVADDSTSSNDHDPFITLIEAYSFFDPENSNAPTWWKYVLAGTTILDRQRVPDHPFVVYVPLPVSHIFHGASFTKNIIPTANAKTALTRSIVDHTIRTNNPRYTVLNGTLTSARELLENKPGGIVNVNKPDGIMPLPQAALNPFVFQTIQLLDTDLSDTTGVSRLSQGLDKNVLSKQNSRGLVQDVTQASEQRTRMMARRFANSFLAQLTKKIYDCVVANQPEGVEYDVDGEMAMISPGEWPDSVLVKVDLDLSPDQKEKKVADIIETVGAISQDPALGQTFQFPYKRRLAVKVLKMRGFMDAEEAFSAEAPQPDPMDQRQREAEVSKIEAESQAAMMKLQLAQQELTLEQMKAMKELDLEERKFFLQQMKDQAAQALAERKQAHVEANSLFEKQLIMQQQQESPESIKSIVAVNDK